MDVKIGKLLLAGYVLGYKDQALTVSFNIIIDFCVYLKFLIFYILFEIKKDW